MNMHAKKICCLLLFVFSICFCFAAEDLDEVISRISSDIQKPLNHNAIICILDFSSSSKKMSEYIQSELTASVTDSGEVRVVTRAHMDKINAELDFQLSGVVSEETALSLCQRLGAQAIVFGSIDELDNKYNLQIKMLDVESGSYMLFRTYEFKRSSKTEQLFGRAAIYYKAALGAFLEGNKNSVSNIAPAAGISFDYSLFRKVSFGVKALVSYDAFEKNSTVYVIEPLGFLRWYVVSPSGEPSTGLFVEGQGGIEIILVNSADKIVPSAGLSIGFRFPLGNFYFEPMLRGGYPYMFGIGISAGLRF